MSDVLPVVCAVALPFTGAVAGAYLARRNMDWFKGLKTPSLPPCAPAVLSTPAVLGSVCGSIGVSMGAASYLVWRDGGGFDGDAATPLAFYSSQLLLGWAWPGLFFGLKSPKLACIDAVCLWGAAAATVYNFQGVSDAAAMLMLPHLLAVSAGTYANYRIMKDSPKITEVTEDKESKTA